MSEEAYKLHTVMQLHRDKIIEFENKLSREMKYSNELMASNKELRVQNEVQKHQLQCKNTTIVELQIELTKFASKIAPLPSDNPYTDDTMDRTMPLNQFGKEMESHERWNGLERRISELEKDWSHDHNVLVSMQNEINELKLKDGNDLL